MSSPHDSVNVPAADVIRIMCGQIAEMSKNLAIMQARAELAEKMLAARDNGNTQTPVRAVKISPA